METLGELTRNYRERARISQVEMARRTGIPQGTISRIETGAYLRSAFGERAKQGKFPQGRAPFGYERPNRVTVRHDKGGTYERETGDPVINPEQAAIVREIFRRVADGESVAQICRSLRERGSSPGGEQWQRTTIYKIVRKPIYYGGIQYAGKVTAVNPRWAIVDEMTWRKANDRLDRGPKLRQRSDRPRPWLDGLVRHSCGQLMRSYVKQRTPTAVQFKCNAAQLCGHERVSLSGRFLEPAVRQLLELDLGAIRPPEETIDLALDMAGGKHASQARTTLDKRQAAAEKKYRRVLDLYANDKLDTAMLDEQVVTIRAELDAIEAERAALPEPPDPEAIRATFASLATFRDVLAELKDSDLRDLIMELGHVEVGGDGVRIVYRPELAPLVNAHRIPIERWKRWPHAS